MQRPSTLLKWIIREGLNTFSCEIVKKLDRWTDA
jgi:hypothetical protein